MIRLKPKLVVEAKTGLPFRYNGYFAVSRDLPESGEILEADLGQVVLGWSNESSSWQLGLTLSPEISLARSSRWFELLRFTNADAAAHEAVGDSTGRRPGEYAWHSLRLNRVTGDRAGAGAGTDRFGAAAARSRSVAPGARHRR